MATKIKKEMTDNTLLINVPFDDEDSNPNYKHMNYVMSIYYFLGYI